jgi:hypothetical protein
MFRLANAGAFLLLEQQNSAKSGSGGVGSNALRPHLERRLSAIYNRVQHTVMKTTWLIGLASACSIHFQSLGQPALQSTANQLQEQSLRLNQLRTQIIGGDQAAVDRFWKSLVTEHTPILEPIANETENALVTFVWRGNSETKGVSVMGREMTRLLETDLWFTTLRMDPKVPIFYSFFPRVAGDSEQRSADPLNPHRFLMPPEAEAAIPEDLRTAHAQWRQSSMLLFSKESPDNRWTDLNPSVPKGKVEMFTLEEKGRARMRRLWVYTPPNYDREVKVPCRLLICFDGVSYLSEIPVPTILNNLIAADEIWPTVAIMVDNGSEKESAEDLDNHAAFADFLGRK